MSQKWIAPEQWAQAPLRVWDKKDTSHAHSCGIKDPSGRWVSRHYFPEPGGPVLQILDNPPNVIKKIMDFLGKANTAAVIVGKCLFLH